MKQISCGSLRKKNYRNEYKADAADVLQYGFHRISEFEHLASPFHRIVYKTPAEYCRRENRDSAPPETESDISPEAPDL